VDLCKAFPGFFLRIFSSLTCLKKPIFNKRDLLRWKVPVRLYSDVLAEVEGTSHAVPGRSNENFKVFDGAETSPLIWRQRASNSIWRQSAQNMPPVLALSLLPTHSPN
jgi:hypothetical protein